MAQLRWCSSKPAKAISRESLLLRCKSRQSSDGGIVAERKKDTNKQRENAVGQRMWSKLHIWNSDQGGSTKLQLQRLIISRGCIHRPLVKLQHPLTQPDSGLSDRSELSIVATIACSTLHDDLHLSNLTAARKLTAAHTLRRAMGPVHADHVRQPWSNHWSAMWSCDV